MSTKNYGNAGSMVNVDFGSDFGPDEILKYMQTLQQMGATNQANKRAERQLLMQEAQHKYNMDLERQTRNLGLAFTNFSQEGLDYKALGTQDTGELFSIQLPEVTAGWDKYKAEARVNGIEKPDMMKFQQQTIANQANYMNNIISRFNYEMDTIRRDNPNASESELYEYAQEHFNANNVYKQYSKLQSLGAQNLSPLKYSPPTTDDPWYVDWNLVDKEVGTGEYSPGWLSYGALPAAGLGYKAIQGISKYLNSDQIQQLAKLREDLAYEKELRGLGPKGRGSLQSGRNKIRKEIDELIGKLETEHPKKEWVRKKFESIKKGGASLKDSAKGLSSKSILKTAKNIGKATPFYMATDWAAKKIGGDDTVAGNIGQIGATLGTPAIQKMSSNIYNKVKKMGTKKALEKIIKKGGWKLAAKVAGKGALATIGAPLSGGVSTVIGAGLLVKDLSDIYNILMED